YGKIPRLQEDGAESVGVLWSFHIIGNYKLRSDPDYQVYPLITTREVFETDEELGNNRAGGVMGFCVSPLGTPARLLWSTSFFRHKLMIF
ncbi:hypothetical protein SDJN02_07179, partial [Cucurbita argyrosperma subsp. argyrosperma]